MALAGLPRVARLLYISVMALGLATACLLLWWTRARSSDWTFERALLALVLGGACVLFQLASFTIVWRGHRLALHPDEGALLLGFVVLPAPIVLSVAIASSVIGQAAMRRPLLKAAFNVAAQSAATAAGAMAFEASRAEGLSLLGAALLIPPVVSLTNQAIVASFLTALSGRGMREAWSAGLLMSVSVASLTGLLVGVVFVALYKLHPLLTIAGVPGWLLLHRSMSAAIYTENELVTRRALNTLSAQLLDARESAEVICATLDACDEAFAPTRRGASHSGSAYGDLGPPARGLTRVAVPLAASSNADGGALWIELPPRGAREKERLATLLSLVANHASLAIARVDAAKESELQRGALARAERHAALGTLVAGVAHEVNNPLMYMGASVDLLEMDLAEIEKVAGAGESGIAGVDLSAAREGIERVRAGIRRIHRVTKALAIIAREQRSPRRQLVDVLALARDVEAVVRPKLPQGVVLLVAGDDDARILGVARDLSCAVLALVQNCVEALPPEGGAIRLVCAVIGEDVALQVQDDGAGMSNDVREQAFVPFFTTKPDATGLGLAGVLSIVSAHGGSVRLESEPRRGTCVELRIPRAPASAASS